MRLRVIEHNLRKIVLSLFLFLLQSNKSDLQGPFSLENKETEILAPLSAAPWEVFLAGTLLGMPVEAAHDEVLPHVSQEAFQPVCVHVQGGVVV